MAFNISWNDQIFQKKIQRFIKKAKDSRALLEAIAIQGERSMEDNFKNEKGPSGKWAPLSPVTKQLRRNKDSSSIKILQDTGTLSKLGHSIIGGTLLKIGTTVNYGKIHNEGGTSNFFGTQVTIPKRAWAYISKEGSFRMLRAMRIYFKEGI